VHPATFKDYRPEHLHFHGLEVSGTIYQDLLSVKLLSVGALWNWILKSVLDLTALREPQKRFTHIHSFPNKLFYFNDFFMSFVELRPLQVGVTQYKQYFLVTKDIRRNPYSWLMAKILCQFLKFAVNRITTEDCRILPKVQEGNFSALLSGVLSRREERVYHFQKWLKSARL